MNKWKKKKGKGDLNVHGWNVLNGVQYKLDIIIEKEMHKKKLLPTNTQNSHNSVYYKQIIADAKNFEKRGDEFTFNIA